MSLDFFEKLTLGRPTIMRSMAGTDFAVFLDATEEVRSCVLPAAWYKAPTRSPEKHMQLTKRGWLYWTTRAQLIDDMSDTFVQLATSYGSVREIRVATLQRLVTTNEWQATEEVVNRVIAERGLPA